MRKYQETIEARWTGRYDDSIKLVGDLAGKAVLDIGCSIGWFESFAVRENSGLVVGLDRDFRSLRYASRAVPGAYFLRGILPDLPFKNDSFDIVVMWEVLEHLPRRELISSLRSIRRFLKSEGRFYFSVPKWDLRSALTDPAWYFGHRHYTRKGLEELLGQTDFDLIRVRSGGGFFEVISMLLLYPFKWLGGWEVPGKDFFEKKRRSEYI